jgi:hypothetical protein
MEGRKHESEGKKKEVRDGGGEGKGGTYAMVDSAGEVMIFIEFV